jgi:methylated-DNA-[protein]-cysteine S-methyltransferase
MTTVSPELDARFRAAAASSGLLDAAYDIVTDTPLGDLLLGVTDHGLCRIHFDPDPERELESLARQFGPRVLRSAQPVERVKLQLDEYFAGKRRAFDVDWDLRPLPAFNQRVLAELAHIEYGTTTTYGDLAAVSGSPRAARAVGTVMNRNPIPIVLPCHRVVGANGKLVGYAGGLERKEQLLRLEGSLL